MNKLSKTIRISLPQAVLALLLLPSFAPVPGFAQQPATSGSADFEIPAESLVDALSKFGAQTGMQVVYAPQLARGLKSRALTGRLTVEAALKQLLEGTGLTWSYVNGSTVMLKRAGSTSSAMEIAGQLRLAADGEADSGKTSSAGARDPKDNQQIIVEGEREKPKPFSDRNVDLPRTIDDVQPYYIFDAKTIQSSGAVNIEEFLKRRLTMNTTAKTSSQQVLGDLNGNTSSINLRGLGADKTLILVNGRRMAPVTIRGNSPYQADLNGIPLAAIDRIEVLPTSASGIYGGSAVGGVINVILKKDYTGAQVQLSYDNTVDADAPTRTVSANYGVALEGGRTHASVLAQWSDSKPLYVGDRRAMIDRGLNIVLRNSPGSIYSNLSPFFGAVPNITSYAEPLQLINGDYAGANLVLDDGRALNSPFTYVPAGTSPSTSRTALSDALLANAGKWNLDLPASTNGNTGLLQPLGVTPQTQSLTLSVRRQMLPSLDAYVELARYENNSTAENNVYLSGLFLRGDDLANPFTTDILINTPNTLVFPYSNDSVTDTLTTGLTAQLPREWTLQADYTWSRNRFSYSRVSMDNYPAVNADLASGALNPMVDTLAFPLEYSRYMSRESYPGSSTLHDIALRGFGPLWPLPWGKPALAFGLEYRNHKRPETTVTYDYPPDFDASGNVVEAHYYASHQATRSGYAELTVPLAAKNRFPLLHALDLQVAGRHERYEVDAGTEYWTLGGDGSVFYSGTLLNGQPYFATNTYSAHNFTAGFKYQPVEAVTLRVSTATAFTPPSPDSLLRSPELASPTTITDPMQSPSAPLPGCTVSGGVVRCQVARIFGGNPDLKPENSESFNVGLIWQPKGQALRGLRINAEYYKIEQFDATGSLSAQTFVDNPDLYPGRVARDSTGKITLVDLSLINLYHRETEGWDLNVDYRLDTRVGAFDLHAVQSTVLHLKNQFNIARPEFDAVNFPSENGAARHKSNATLSWERGRWVLGWSLNYFSAYKQFGAVGGPTATRNGSVSTTYILPQGSDTIPSQTYNDMFVSYSSPSGAGSGLGAFLLEGVNVQLGIRNVFDTKPPFDYYYEYYTSPYGDKRLRSYWINLKKDF